MKALRRQTRRIQKGLDELNAALEGVAGTTDMLARRPSGARRLRVLFLIHYMEAWDSVADVVDIVRADEGFDLTVASIPRRLPGSTELSGEDLTHERLNALEVPHIRLDDSPLAQEAIKQLDPDLIFRQSQWDRDIPQAFSTANLRFARLALIPYELCNIVENVPTGTVVNDSGSDSFFHRNCWAVFCANQMVKKRASDHSPSTAARQYVVTGHPKSERLRRSIEAAPTSTERPYTILWSAHHSIDDSWSRFGLFPAMAPDMIEWARGMPQWRFVFSPHPSLLTAMEVGRPPLTRDAVDSFWQQWAELPNAESFTGGRTGTYGHVMASADVCVTDGLSMLIEFQIANKPLIHVARADHRPFNEIGELARRGFHTVASTAEARTLVDRFAAGEPDPLAEAQRQVVDDLFGRHDAASEIVEYIRQHLDGS